MKIDSDRDMDVDATDNNEDRVNTTIAGKVVIQYLEKSPGTNDGCQGEPSETEAFKAKVAVYTTNDKMHEIEDGSVVFSITAKSNTTVTGWPYGNGVPEEIAMHVFQRMSIPMFNASKAEQLAEEKVYELVTDQLQSPPKLWTLGETALYFKIRRQILYGGNGNSFWKDMELACQLEYFLFEVVETIIWKSQKDKEAGFIHAIKCQFRITSQKKRFPTPNEVEVGNGAEDEARFVQALDNEFWYNYAEQCLHNNPTHVCEDWCPVRERTSASGNETCSLHYQSNKKANGTENGCAIQCPHRDDGHLCMTRFGYREADFEFKNLLHKHLNRRGKSTLWLEIYADAEPSAEIPPSLGWGDKT